MATYKVRDPQGNIREISGPDGASDADVIAQAKRLFSEPAQKAAPLQQIDINGPQPESMGPMEMLGEAAMGGLRGAARIGTTAMLPIDAATDYIKGDRGPTLSGLITGQQPKSRNEEREADIDQFMGERANTDSLLYKGGDIAAQIAGTSGVGGLMGKAATKIPGAAKYAELLQSGGFKLGGADTGNKLANALMRFGGGAATGGAATAMVSPEDTGTGVLISGATPLAVQGAAKVGQLIGSGLRSGSESMMQSALKPSIDSLRSGDAKIAIQTLLDEGINPTMGGVRKMQASVGQINDKIDDLIKDSTAKIDKQKVINTLRGTTEKFANQVTPESDLSAIRAVGDEFANHPKLAALNAREIELRGAIKRAGESRISALQDAGRFQTMAAQQKNLAGGKPISLSPQQTMNTPYFNVGATGGEARSFRQLAGQARPPERYTPNMAIVPGAKDAAQEAMTIAAQRKAEQIAAQKALAEHVAAGGSGIPVQLAQELKKGTYQVLKGKYGEVGSASTEAQKALARGLKEGIADAVPDIAGLNARESALLKTLDVAERRALMEANKNPMGLSILAGNKAAMTAFLADRSAAFKSIFARMTNNASKVANATRALENFAPPQALITAPAVTGAALATRE